MKSAFTMAFAAIALSTMIVGCVGSGGSGSQAAPSERGAGGAGTGRPGPSRVVVTCHNRASDAGALQKAINSSPAGSVIAIGGASCLLTRGIVLLSGRTYEGGSMTGTVLRQDARMDFVLASSSYVHDQSSTGNPLSIRDLTVDCNGTGHTDGIILVNWLASVEHVYVRNCGGSGIVDSSRTANGSSITNTSVNSRFDNNFISNCRRYGFYVNDPRNAVTDGYLEDNQIADTGRDAIHLDDASGWDISGNHLYGVGHSAIYASRLYGTTISDNFIEDFGTGQTSGTWFGIEATAQGGIGSAISGNKVFDPSGPPGVGHIYIGITQVNSGTSYLAATGNVIVGSGTGVGLMFNSGANRLVVASSGNLIAGVSTTVRRLGSVAVSSGT